MTRRHPKKMIWSSPAFAVLLTFLSWVFSSFCYAQSGSRQNSTDNIQLRAVANEEFGDPEFEQERIKSINDRIKLLKSILEDEKNQQISEATKPPARPRLESPSDPVAPDTSQELPLPPKPEDVSTQALVESKIATSAINSFELGYSLFMTGNFKAASSNFEALLEKRRPPEETAWLQCFIGCCDRLQQDFDHAENRFRNTVDQKLAPDVTARHADWNLQYITQRKQSTEAMKQVSQQLDQILKEIENAR